MCEIAGCMGFSSGRLSSGAAVGDRQADRRQSGGGGRQPCMTSASTVFRLRIHDRRRTLPRSCAIPGATRLRPVRIPARIRRRLRSVQGATTPEPRLVPAPVPSVGVRSFRGGFVCTGALRPAQGNGAMPSFSATVSQRLPRVAPQTECRLDNGQGERYTALVHQSDYREAGGSSADLMSVSL